MRMSEGSQLQRDYKIFVRATGSAERQRYFPPPCICSITGMPSCKNCNPETTM
jgi:hypothetical protein